jgi:hypothetical protein
MLGRRLFGWRVFVQRLLEWRIFGRQLLRLLEQWP